MARQDGGHYDSRLGSLVNCSCYAKRLAPEIQFGMHFGAHSLSCPVYRVSHDELDARRDIEFRELHEAGVGRCTCCD